MTFLVDHNTFYPKMEHSGNFNLEQNMAHHFPDVAQKVINLGSILERHQTNQFIEDNDFRHTAIMELTHGSMAFNLYKTTGRVGGWQIPDLKSQDYRTEKARLENLGKRLDSEFAQIKPLPQDVVSYSGLKLGAIKSLTHMRPGDTTIFRNVLSSTINVGRSFNFGDMHIRNVTGKLADPRFDHSMVLHLSKGSKQGFYIGSNSAYPAEKELMIKPNTRAKYLGSERFPNKSSIYSDRHRVLHHFKVL